MSLDCFDYLPWLELAYIGPPSFLIGVFVGALSERRRTRRP